MGAARHSNINHQFIFSLIDILVTTYINEARAPLIIIHTSSNLLLCHPSHSASASCNQYLMFWMHLCYYSMWYCSTTFKYLAFSFTSLCVFPAAWQHGWAFSLYVYIWREVKKLLALFTFVLLRNWMISAWKKLLWHEHLSSSSLLADLSAILIFPRYQLAVMQGAVSVSLWPFHFIFHKLTTSQKIF